MLIMSFCDNAAELYYRYVLEYLMFLFYAITFRLLIMLLRRNPLPKPSALHHQEAAEIRPGNLKHVTSIKNKMEIFHTSP